MISRTVVLPKEFSFVHGIPTARFVQLVREFTSDVVVEYRGEKADARSTMSLLVLCAPSGSSVTLHANGTDEEQALDAIEQFMESC